MKRLACLLLVSIFANAAAAQFTDDFSDGDLTRNPPWSGDLDRWTIADRDGMPMLRSDGVAEADTIYLSTPSAVSYGRWSFTFAHREVNLSNFNGARVFLIADTPTLDGPVHGYYLQMGTNNSNEVRLYRIDGDPATRRVELGRSKAMLAGESNTLLLTVTREQGGRWDVSIDGESAFAAEDNTYQFSQHAGVWAKHSASNPRHLYFDAFVVEGARGPVGEEPFVIVFAEEVEEETAEVWFSGMVDPASVRPENFLLSNDSPAETVELRDENTRARVRFGHSLTGDYLRVDGVRDYGGREPRAESIPLAYRPPPGELLINEIMYQPRVDRFDARPDQAEYVELYNASNHRVSLRTLYWTGPPDRDGAADTLVVGKEAVAVEPGGFALIFAEPDGVSDLVSESRLAEAFPESDLSAAALLPQSRATLGLRTGGDRIRLHRGDHAILDEVNYLPDWHHPTVRDVRGVALERLDLNAPSNSAANWTSSVAEAGGTPGAPNSVHLASAEPPRDVGLSVHPSPFNPEGSGEERFARIRYELSSPSSSLRARIFDSYGREVRTLEEAYLTGQSGELIWDGLDEAGQSLRTGIYVVHLEAVDISNGTTETLRAPVVLARPLDE